MCRTGILPVSKDVLNKYFVKIYEYLQVVEQRLFSSGLHVLGEAPNTIVNC